MSVIWDPRAPIYDPIYAARTLQGQADTGRGWGFHRQPVVALWGCVQRVMVLPLNPVNCMEPAGSW